MTTDQDATLLRSVGLRVTGTRLAALDVVRHHSHATADEVAIEVRDRLGTVSKQAIYDILRALTDVGILRRITVDGRGTQYELDFNDNHHHMVCRICGSLEDVPCPIGTPPCLEPPVDDRFAVDEAEVIYRGICSECQDEQAKATEAAITTKGSAT